MLLLHAFNFSDFNVFFCRISPTVLASHGRVADGLQICLDERRWPLMGCLEGIDMQTKPALDQDKIMLILGELNVLLFFFAQTCHSARF